MYRYDEIDQRLVDERVRQFRDQTRRFLAGELADEDFKHLRLRNGLYLQRHAPMLRVAIPYGLLASAQLRKLAHIARTYDRGYGHFTTRQNLQFNWPRLEDVPEILAELATVEMHAIQTSGNCVRNITTDHFAGVAADEVVDSFVWCEIVRQWSTFSPEFSWLPRKFKIAINGAAADRAATWVHDIGLHAVRDAAGEVGFRVIAGGGLGRTPIIGHVVREFLPWQHLLTYLDAILRVYNRYGRRDNIHKARIKILVKERGPDEFRREVDEEWAHLKDGPATLVPEEIARVESRFTRPAYEEFAADGPGVRGAARRRPCVLRLDEAQRPSAQGRGLRRSHRLAQENRRTPGRRHRGPDGRARRPRRSLQLRRAARFARAEPDLRRRGEARSARAVARAPRRSVSRPRTSASSRTSSPARAATSARSRTRARSRSQRRSSGGSTTSTTSSTSARSISTSPAA